MNTKHTLGPWSLDDYRNIVGLNGEIVKVQGMSLSSGNVARANARLIVAAPDLLAALEVVVADWTAQFERNGHQAPAWCKQARDAIAKATGEAS